MILHAHLLTLMHLLKVQYTKRTQHDTKRPHNYGEYLSNLFLLTRAMVYAMLFATFLQS